MPGVVLGTATYVFQIETEIATEWPILGSLAGLIAAHTLIVIPWTVRIQKPTILQQIAHLSSPQGSYA